MASSKPIALPTNNNMDYQMGSYSNEQSGPFNPASYTRHFLGSPISWRAGSFGARFPQGSPSANLFSSLDNPKPSSSIEVMNAFNVFDREGELTRNYNCCGIHLPDLHALLEHFEEAHVIVVDPSGSAQISIPFNPQPLDNQPPPPSFDSDDMELELDLDNSTHPPLPTASRRSSPTSSSPPHTPNNSVLAQFAHNYPQFQIHSGYNSPYTSQPPSPGSTNPHVHFPNAGPGAQAVVTHPEEAFNAYARFSADYSSHMPGTQFNASGGDEIQITPDYATYVGQVPPVGQQCIPPALLFSSSSPPPSSNNVETSPRPTSPHTHTNKLKLKVRGGHGISSSTPSTPSTASALTPFSTNTSTPSPSTTALSIATSLASTPSSTPALPIAPTPLLLSKPFRCPKPNCNKSYKQANGLKYHMTHGSCNFAPPKDLEHVKDLLERKRREREANAAAAGLSRSASLGALSRTDSATAPNGEPYIQYGDLGAITETELREAEREAEKRVRPFACGVGDCQRRYKNMNGLRYHYQHSGDHGAMGLALLAQGLHECLRKDGNGSGSGDEKSKSHSQVSQTLTQEEREGRRRGGAPGGVQRLGHGHPHHAHAHAHAHGIGRGGASGSASVPVSRATSVVAGSRVGTPVPVVPVQLSVPVPQSLQKSVSAGAAASLFPTTNGTAPTNTTSSSPGAGASNPGSGATTPFTPGYTNPAAAGVIGQAAATHNADILHHHHLHHQTSSPPLTPLTAAVQGMGITSSSSQSQPSSPGGNGNGSATNSQQQQQQQQLAYQAQFVELQRRQYMQMQQQQQMYQAQAQQQQQPQQQSQSPQRQQQYAQQQQQYGMVGDADARAQQEFVEAQRREFEFQQHQNHHQQQMGLGDVAMA